MSVQYTLFSTLNRNSCNIIVLNSYSVGKQLLIMLLRAYTVCLSNWVLLFIYILFFLFVLGYIVKKKHIILFYQLKSIISIWSGWSITSMFNIGRVNSFYNIQWNLSLGTIKWSQMNSFLWMLSEGWKWCSFLHYFQLSISGHILS